MTEVESQRAEAVVAVARAQGSQAGPSSDGGYPGDLGSAGLALSTNASGCGRMEVHGMPFSVGARGGVVEAMRKV